MAGIVKRVVRWILIGSAAIFIVWAVSLPFVIAAIDGNISARAAPPSLPMSLAVGGTACYGGTYGKTFTTANRIRLISNKDPGGEDVMIELFPLPHDTNHPAPSGYPARRHFEATAACVSEDLPALSPGAYETWVHVGESSGYIDFRVIAP